jgi:multimeric flavodoxin WrbA
MKKVLLISSSPRAGQTRKTVEIFIRKLGNDYKCEVINLRDYKLAECQGCALCLSKREDSCPGREGKMALLEKMDAADAIVFATPNYVLNVPALFKNFLDHFAFVCHRPRFFGQVFTGIITQGAYGGGAVDKYLNKIAGFWGGRYVPGAIITLSSGSYNPTLPWTGAEEESVEDKLDSLASKLKKELEETRLPSPSLFQLVLFRFTRSAHRFAKEDNYDYYYFQGKGWFESDYYSDVKLNPLQKVIGAIADIAAKMFITK